MPLFHYRASKRTPSPGPSTIVIAPSATPVAVVAGTVVTFADAPISITNGTSNPISAYVVSDDAAWLTFTSVTDTATGAVTLTPVVDASALSAGSYTGTFTVTDVRASNSPQTGTVALTVTAVVPTIGLTPGTLSVSLVDEAVGGTQTVLISNLGSSALAIPTIGTIVYAGGMTGFITSPAITSNGDGSYNLTFGTTAVGGTVGTGYTATIPIISTGASNTPQNVTVNFTVTAQAMALLVLDRGLDDMSGTAGGSNPNAQTVGVRSGNATPLSGPSVLSTTYGGDFTGWATATWSGNTLTVTPDITSLPSGSGYVDYVIQDGAAGNTATYRVFLKLSVATFPAAIRAAPTGVGASATVGSSPVSAVVIISNGGSGGLAALGTVTNAFTTPVPWCTTSYNTSTGELTLIFSTGALAEGVHSATLRVNATLTSIAFIDIPVSVTMSAVVAPGTWPSPPSWLALPAGWTWNSALGYPEGSCMNGVAHANLANGARPSFSGTTHQIPETYATWGAASAAITAGTIVPGDIISIRADQVITDAQIPVIPARTISSLPICIQSRDIASLPAYSYASGPNSYGVNNRGGNPAHLSLMPTFRSVLGTGSAFYLQKGGGGYWFEGIRFRKEFATGVGTTTILSTEAYTGTTSNVATSTADIPTVVILDRCHFGSSHGHTYAIEQHARYVRITHCTADYARHPNALASDNYESKFLYTISTDGKMDILGNEFSALGIGILVGGSDPDIPHINPSDGMVLWNRYPNQAIANNGTDGDDDKNFFENKTGKRWFVAFNRATDICGRQDQKFAFLSKSVDANGGNNFIAHSTDQMMWCNYIHGAKGMYGAAPRTVTSSSALDSERLGCMYNLVLTVWDKDHYPGLWKRSNPPPAPLWGFGPGDRLGMQISKSQGQGIQTIQVEHNTFGVIAVEPGDTLNMNAFLELDSVALGTWSNISFDNNVMVCQTRFGPFRGNQSSNATAMNGVFGPGNWSARRNLVLPGGNGIWDATLLGAGYNNGYLLSAGNFVDTASNNYTLVAGHPAKGTGFGTNADPGYNHAYFTAMTSTVLSNAGA